jgi:hypothetical protein
MRATCDKPRKTRASVFLLTLFLVLPPASWAPTLASDTQDRAASSNKEQKWKHVTSPEIRSLAEEASALLKQGKVKELFETGEKALELARKDDKPLQAASILVALANGYALVGDVERSRRYASEGLAAC